jgi:hypothetical protein
MTVAFPRVAPVPPASLSWTLSGRNRPLVFLATKLWVFMQTITAIFLNSLEWLNCIEWLS